MQPNRYSVALCTHNGARFLKEQLASIAAQTRKPDELIVSDDVSTDNTLELLEAFRREAPFPVFVFAQPVNLGSTRNFEYALRQCTGDLIALADQDDVWSPQRLEASEDFMQRHADAAFVFTDGTLIDEAGKSQAQTLWQTFHFDPSLQNSMQEKQYSILLRHRFITGATITLRAGLLPHVLPFPSSWVHDEWLAAATPFYADIGMLAAPLLRYRVHAAQQVGAQRARSSSASIHWAEVERQQQQMRDVLAHLDQHPALRHYELVDAYRARAAAMDRRATMPSERIRRTVQVIRNLADYNQYAAGPWSALKDIVLSKPNTGSG